MEKVIILIPNFNSIMTEGYYKYVQNEANPGTLITNNFEQVRALVRLREASKVIIIQGAINCATLSGQINTKQAYDELKKESQTVPIIVIDGWDWGIPNQIVVTGESHVLNQIQRAFKST